MKGQFVPYDIAVMLKGLGFDDQCIAFYNGLHISYKIDDNDGTESPDIHTHKDIGECPNAPLWQQVFDWARRKYGINAIISPIADCYNITSITKYNEETKDNEDILPDNIDWIDFKSHYDARTTCVQAILLLIKTEYQK